MHFSWVVHKPVIRNKSERKERSAQHPLVITILVADCREIRESSRRRKRPTALRQILENVSRMGSEALGNALNQGAFDTRRKIRNRDDPKGRDIHAVTGR